MIIVKQNLGQCRFIPSAFFGIFLIYFTKILPVELIGGLIFSLDLAS